MNVVLNKIMHIIFAAMFVIIYGCVLKSYMESGMLSAVMGGIVLCGAAIFAFSFLKKHKNLITQKRLLYIFIAVQVLMLVGQIFVVAKLGYVPTRDVEYVDTAARNFGISGNFDTINIMHGKTRFYFSKYPNNWGILLFLSFIYRAFFLILGFIPKYLSCALNIICIQLSAFLMFRLSKQIFKGTTKPLFCILILFLHPACYINAPIFYTDVLTMPFVLGAILLFVKAFKAKSNKKFILYLILTAVVTAFGFTFKGSLAVLLVAFIIFSFLKLGWKKCLCFAGALVICVTAVNKTVRFTGIELGISDAQTLDAYELPITHWINMSMHGSGRFNAKDTAWVSKFDTLEERKSQTLSSIKKRILKYGLTGLTQQGLKKITETWNNGTFYGNYLDECENHSFRYSLTEGKAMTLYSQSVHFMLLTLMLCGFIYGVYHTKIKGGGLLKLVVFGFALFFVFWEIKPRYILDIMPLFILIAADGLAYANSLWKKAYKKLKEINSMPIENKLSQNGKKQRIVWIDILRGAMMFFVVYGHSTCRGDVSRYIFSFHMPVFFIISGMTFAFNKEYDAKKYLIKKVKNLLLPYFLLNLYVSPLWFWNRATGSNPQISALELVKGIFISNVDSGYPMASNTTWFITCLFLTDILFFVIRKFCKTDKTLIFGVLLTTCTSYALGILSAKGGGVWHWQVAFTAIVFYLCGYLFMKNISAIREMMLKSKQHTYLLIALFIINGYLISNLNKRVSMVNDSYKNTFYFYAAALFTSFAATLLIMMICENKRMVKLLTPINFIGQTTLAYIAFHVPIIKLLKHYTFMGDKSEYKRLLMAIVIYIGFMPVAWVIKRLLPSGFKLWKKDKKSC